MPELINPKGVLFIFLAAGVLLAGCTGSWLEESQQEWKLTHVRLYDPVDSPEPQSDFVAFYARFEQGELQVRIDWLDQELLPAGDLYLAIDNRPGGKKELPGSLIADIAWDTLILVPFSGEIQALDANFNQQAGFKLRIHRDPVLDTVAIHMDGTLATTGRTLVMPFNRLPESVKIQLLLVDPASGEALDRSTPFGLHGTPVKAAPVLLAFSNVFPAYTPSLTLRRWDGAHSGPEGGRHGLYNLLRAAYGDLSGIGNLSRLDDRRFTPIFLLDLKSPASLPALDFASALPVIHALSGRQALMLPDFQPAVDLPAEPYRNLYLQHLEATLLTNGLNFGLAPSFSLYTSQDGRSIPAKYRVVFFEQSGPAVEVDKLKPTTVKYWQGKLVILYSPEMPVQATPAGPSMELRSALVATTLLNQVSSARADQILLLGGDLPASTWGNPASARATFRYLESRPWINTLDAVEVSSLTPEGPVNFAGDSQVFIQEKEGFHAQYSALVKALLEAPENDLTTAAWQVVDSLYASLYPRPENLYNLRASYLDPAWILIHASDWFESPYSTSSCEFDLDQDGQAECLLSSRDVFSAFDAETGALLALFTRQEQPNGMASVHQLVGPSSQLITGLSDRTGWQMEGNFLFDPAVIPGAFVQPSARLRPQPGAGKLAFFATDNRLILTYNLLPKGIALMLESTSSNEHDQVDIPILYDPWVRFQPGWARKFTEIRAGGSWQLLFDSQVAVQFAASSPVSSASFLSSLPFSGNPEDPNYDFGRGHYLPFPLFLLSVPNQPGLQVEITSP